MAAEAEFRAKGIRELRGVLASLLDFGVRPREFMLLSAAKMQEQIGRTFATATDPMSGAKWQPVGELARMTRSAGGRPLHRTGQLFRSLVTARPTVTDTSAKVSTNLPYAYAHNYGAVITPKNSKFLWIPLTREAGRLGPSGMISKYGKLLRFAFKANSGTVTLRRTPVFRLVKAVTIPQRRFLGWSKQHIDDIVQVGTGIIEKKMREAAE